MLQMIAGGGTVLLSEFLIAGSCACLLSALFSIAGCRLLFHSGLRQDNTISMCGYYYFLGMALFLVSMKLFTQLGWLFDECLFLSIVFLIGVSISGTKKSILKKQIHQWITVGIATFIISFLALFLLNYIARNRGGPFYADLVNYIIESKQLPLLNRHHGQSILGAVALRWFPSQSVNLSRMGVNLWLPISQAFLCLITYNLAKHIFKSRFKSLLVCAIAIAGNCSLSMLPQIPTNHDFPLLYNVYADSVIGIGIAIILFILIRHNSQLSKTNINSLLMNLGLIYLMFTALNITSELNFIVLAIALIPVFLVATLQQFNFEIVFRYIAIYLVLFAAIISSYFMGGIFLPKYHVTTLAPKYQKIFGDDNANASVGKMKMTDMNQWYLPYSTPGFYKDYGNYDSIFDEPISRSFVSPGIYADFRKYDATHNAVLVRKKPFNAVVMNRGLKNTDESLTSSRFLRMIYLFEMRLATILKILFWPLLACVCCFWLLTKPDNKHSKLIMADINEHESSMTLITREWLIFSISTFFLGLSVIFLNSARGNSVYWKWALTRLNELGIFLMMIYTGIFLVYLLSKIKVIWLRALSSFVIFVMLGSGVLIRALFF